MNLESLPLNHLEVVVNQEYIQVKAIRVNPKTAIVTWEEPRLNEEVLRTRVNIFTGESTLEQFSLSFWEIYIDGSHRISSDLTNLLGKSLSLKADPLERTLEITTQIHHYTNINTLALILKNKTIRFNRLDRVEDMSEAQSLGKFNLANYLFVSCWTDSGAESIPQWHMYTNGMAGVRLTFPKHFFNYRPLKQPPNADLFIQSEVLSPIPFEQLFTDDYIVLPNIVNKDLFGRKVRYVDDIEDIYKDAVNLEIDKQGHANLKIDKVTNLAGYKQKVWEFQSEFRFVLFILPSIPIPSSGISDDKYLLQLPSHIIKSIINGNPPKIEYFDVCINPDILDNIVITLGPLASEGDTLIVDSLLRRYTKNGSFRHSRLKGTIRNPMR